MQLGIIPGNPRIGISRELPGIWKNAKFFFKVIDFEGF
jgi:hypothetical protein